MDVLLGLVESEILQSKEDITSAYTLDEITANVL